MKKELEDFVSENLLDEKLFIVSGITVGKQMQSRMAMKGQPSMNLKIGTLQGLAFEISQEYILKEDKLVIDTILGNNIILSILKDLCQDEDFFFKKDLIDAKTAEEVYKVIMELKLSGVKTFPDTKDLDKIYGAYKARLEEVNGLDYCDIISLASNLETLDRYSRMKIGVASNIEFFNIEKILFEKLTRDNCTRIIMPVDSIENKPKNYYYKDEETDQDLEDKAIRFSGQYGSRNEINYIIEDIKKKRIKLDDVVIAYTNGKYADLINIEFEKNKIPISFGQGLGIKSSSAYRFMDIIIQWSGDYFNVNKIRPIFVNEDVNFKLKGEITFSGQELYRELLDLHIGFGQKNYMEKLGRARKKGNNRVDFLDSFFGDLFHAVPEAYQVNIKDYVPRWINLIRKYVRNISKFDGAAKIEILRALKKIDNIDMMVTKNEYFDIVMSYIEGARILRSQPRPGSVFASNFKHCGYSGRKNLYLIGMDSGSLSNKVIESPILLDDKRHEISDSLSSAKDVYDYKKYKIKELLTSDFRNINLIYSNFNTTDVKEMSPSQIYIELKAKYGKEIKHAEDQDPESLAQAEVGSHAENKDENKNYADGNKKYKDEKFEGAEYELYGRDLVESVTALEVLAECSRKAYFAYALGLEAKEETEIQVSRWLNPMDKGSLVHRVLNIYFRGEGEDDLESLVEIESEKMAEKILCVLEDVYIREKAEILQICQKIVEITEKDKDWEIFANELSFGSYGMEENQVFGSLPDQKLDIMGLELDIRGSIDRVDRNIKDPSLFRIVDYKTGSRNNFDKKLREKVDKDYDYSNTKKLQYYIYKKALDNILRDKKDQYPNAKVAGFNYIFGGEKTRNIIDLDFNQDFIETVENRIKELLDINILEADKDVVYDPEDRNLSCRYCQYRNICMTDKEVNKSEE